VPEALPPGETHDRNAPSVESRTEPGADASRVRNPRRTLHGMMRRAEQHVSESSTGRPRERSSFLLPASPRTAPVVRGHRRARGGEVLLVKLARTRTTIGFPGRRDFSAPRSCPTSPVVSTLAATPVPSSPAERHRAGSTPRPASGRGAPPRSLVARNERHWASDYIGSSSH